MGVLLEGSCFYALGKSPLFPQWLAFDSPSPSIYMCLHSREIIQDTVFMQYGIPLLGVNRVQTDVTDLVTQVYRIACRSSLRA